jgi:hypothetical protein
MPLSEIENGPMPGEDQADFDDINILREAVAARNGWKRILGRCSPDRAAGPARAVGIETSVEATTVRIAGGVQGSASVTSTTSGPENAA